MSLTLPRRSATNAFTLIELIVVIVILAILSGVAIPKYIDYTANAKASATKGTLGGIRSAIANFYANSAVSGTATFPTLAQLTTVGTVAQEPIAANPYTGLTGVVAASWSTTPPVQATPTAGWAYDASNGHFWANSNTASENTW